MIELESNFLRGSYTPVVTPFRDGKVDFDKFADELHTKAEALEKTTAAKDVKATSAGLASIKATCKDCHAKFK